MYENLSTEFRMISYEMGHSSRGSAHVQPHDGVLTFPKMFGCSLKCTARRPQSPALSPKTVAIASVTLGLG